MLAEVGSFLKCPYLPLWVVARPSHYTCLVGTDIRINDDFGILYAREKYMEAFDRLDSARVGMLEVRSADCLIDSLGLRPYFKRGLIQDDLLLRSDFERFCVDLYERQVRHCLEAHSTPKSCLTHHHRSGSCSTLTAWALQVSKNFVEHRHISFPCEPRRGIGPERGPARLMPDSVDGRACRFFRRHGHLQRGFWLAGGLVTILGSVHSAVHAPKRR